MNMIINYIDQVLFLKSVESSLKSWGKIKNKKIERVIDFLLISKPSVLVRRVFIFELLLFFSFILIHFITNTFKCLYRYPELIPGEAIRVKI